MVYLKKYVFYIYIQKNKLYNILLHKFCFFRLVDKRFFYNFNIYSKINYYELIYYINTKYGSQYGFGRNI